MHFPGSVPARQIKAKMSISPSSFAELLDPGEIVLMHRLPELQMSVGVSIPTHELQNERSLFHAAHLKGELWGPVLQIIRPSDVHNILAQFPFVL
jgi:hypothetical protein